MKKIPNKKEIESLVNKIEVYTYKPNGIYLYPLTLYINELRSYFNYKSDNEKFNYYINEILLPRFDYFVSIYFINNKLINYETDIKEIKEGVKYWHTKFKQAFDCYSPLIV